jgi:RNase P subunit RPR2
MIESMEIKVNMQFQCKKCNEFIDHNYTQQDLLDKESLELSCQKCGTSNIVKTSYLIDKAKEEAIKEIKKNFKIG